MSTKVKVLLITYYWPPAGGGGVQRWLKMSKYFSENGIKLTIYTPENPEFPAYDESSIKEIASELDIIKRPIIEPYGFYKKFTGKKKDSKVYSGFINEEQSWKQKLSIWIRGNFFIPDARKYWIKPSIRFLTSYILENKFDAVISTGPPHSMHMIALGVKKKFPDVKWIADFRDPWTNIDFYDQLMLSKRSDKKHRRMEKSVLQDSDLVVTVGWTLAKELEEIGSLKEVKVITNGYDHTDFKEKINPQGNFTLMHLGSMNKDRNPKALWNALSTLKNEGIKPKVEIIGQVDVDVVNCISKYNLSDQVSTEDFIPHSQAVNKMMEAHALLLVINNTPNAAGILTGKLFEYLGAKRPIIVLGPSEGDVRKLLENYSHAFYVEYSDVQACKDAIKNFFAQKEEKTVNDTSQYSRRQLAKKYSHLIKDLIDV